MAASGAGKAVQALEQEIGAMAPKVGYFLRKTYKLADDQSRDLAHDAVVAALEAVRKPGFELAADAKLTTFVHSIAKNKARDFFKAQRHRQHQSIDGHAEVLALPENQPAEFAEVDILKFRKLIERLGEPHGRILYLIYYKGYKVADVAEELNMAPTRVSSLKCAALKQLREWCQDEGFTSALMVVALCNLWRLVHGL